MCRTTLSLSGLLNATFCSKCRRLSQNLLAPCSSSASQRSHCCSNPICCKSSVYAGSLMNNLLDCCKLATGCSESPLSLIDCPIFLCQYSENLP